MYRKKWFGLPKVVPLATFVFVPFGESVIISNLLATPPNVRDIHSAGPARLLHSLLTWEWIWLRGDYSTVPTTTWFGSETWASTAGRHEYPTFDLADIVLRPG